MLLSTYSGNQENNPLTLRESFFSTPTLSPWQFLLVAFGAQLGVGEIKRSQGVELRG